MPLYLIVERKLSQSRLHGIDPVQTPETPVEPILAKLAARARMPKGEGLMGGLRLARQVPGSGIGVAAAQDIARA